MKTTFILHGGRLKVSDPYNDSFCAEITKNLSDGDEVLFIGFARRDEEDRLKIYERDKGYILAQTNKDITVTNATYENLIEQIRNADVIFITGGETGELVKDIRKYPDFIDAIKGKVVAGSSAGAYLFSQYYFSNPEGVCEGLGTLPIKIIGHYGNPQYKGTEESLHLLKNYGEDLEVIVVNECEWTVREIAL